MGGVLARDNYSYQKYRREQAKKQKKEAKLQKKLEKKKARESMEQGQVISGDAAPAPDQVSPEQQQNAVE